MRRVLPILFNTEMVRAISDGRKTCTRRVIKAQPDEKHTFPLGFVTGSTEAKELGCFGFGTNENGGSIQFVKPPYQAGDILYVRETIWQKTGHYLDVDGETKAVWCNEFRYAASDEKPEVGWNYSWGKRPSIHMPKEAARIWLKVTDVRVERLQEITSQGAWKEGARCPCLYPVPDCAENKTAFIEIWNITINKTDLDCYGWDANPWVWVIEFERCEKPQNEGEASKANPTGQL